MAGWEVVGSTFTIGCISYISYVGHGWVMGGGEGGGGGEGAEINQRRGTEVPIAYIIGVGRLSWTHNGLNAYGDTPRKPTRTTHLADIPDPI
jgi:hypothetical protein